MNKFLPTTLAALALVSCSTRSPQAPLSIETTKPLITEQLPQLPHVIRERIPLPPNIKTINWQNSLLPIIKKMMLIDSINDKNVLLVNTMQNNTNGSLQTNEATSTLIRLIVEIGNKFSVVSTNKLHAIRQTLGLSANDNLESRSKAIGLARYLNAQYMLYSTACGEVNNPDLDLQLILVRTGEIIWSGQGVTQK